MAEGNLAADVEEAQQSIIGGSGGSFTIRCFRQSQLHVRLAGDQPDFAYQDIPDLERISSHNRQRPWVAAGVQCRKLDTPLAFSTRNRRLRLACESHRDALATTGS